MFELHLLILNPFLEHFFGDKFLSELREPYLIQTILAFLRFHSVCILGILCSFKMGMLKNTSVTMAYQK